MNRTLPSTARIALTLALSALGLSAPAAFAQDLPWTAHIGWDHIAFSESAKLKAAGTEIPGANADATNSSALVVDFQYHFTPDWSASVNFGTTPKSTISGAGSAAAFGKFGEVSYAPVNFFAQYHFNPLDSVKPYIGAGAVYYMIRGTRDAAITQLHVDTGWGSGIEAGIEVPLASRYSFFVDVRKLFVKTKASGNLTAVGGAPVTADIILNPLAIHVGIGIAF